MRRRSQIYSSNLRDGCGAKVDLLPVSYTTRRKLNEVFHLLYGQLKSPLSNYLHETNAKEAI